jgi:L-aminopeptidase/D-esterase-like protein
MPAGRLTDVPGIRVGHWTDADAGTGCTVVIPPPGSIGAVDVRGGGASARETELLAPLAGDREITALLFTGGSAFGLAAADGVMRWCEERGMGLDTPGGRVPIVPAAVIYDLGITANRRRPGPDEGYAACVAATDAPHAVGSVGAGTGATVGKLNGRDGWCKGGLGAASATLLDGATVAVLAVVNAFGDVLGEDGRVIAGVWDPERGFLNASRHVLVAAPAHPRLSQAQHTTLVCVATDARLTKTEAGQVTRMAQTGIARAVSPVNTPLDGDAAVCIATGARESSAFVCGVVAAELAAEAVRDAVREATPLRGVPTGAEVLAAHPPTARDA